MFTSAKIFDFAFLKLYYNITSSSSQTLFIKHFKQHSRTKSESSNLVRSQSEDETTVWKLKLKAGCGFPPPHAVSYDFI